LSAFAALLLQLRLFRLLAACSSHFRTGVEDIDSFDLRSRTFRFYACLGETLEQVRVLFCYAPLINIHWEPSTSSLAPLLDASACHPNPHCFALQELPLDSLKKMMGQLLASCFSDDGVSFTSNGRALDSGVRRFLVIS